MQNLLYQAKKNDRTTEMSPQVRAHGIKILLSGCKCCYGMPVSRTVVFFQLAVLGMRYGMPSGFEIPRGYAAWRARGPPMAVTETGAQYLAILFQPHSCSARQLGTLAVIMAGPSRPVLTVGRVTYYSIVFRTSCPASQEPVPHTG